MRCRRLERVDKITVFVDSDFAGDPDCRKSTTGSVAQIGTRSEIWIQILAVARYGDGGDLTGLEGDTDWDTDKHEHGDGDGDGDQEEDKNKMKTPFGQCT